MDNFAGPDHQFILHFATDWLIFCKKKVAKNFEISILKIILWIFNKIAKILDQKTFLLGNGLMNSFIKFFVAYK